MTNHEMLVSIQQKVKKINTELSKLHETLSNYMYSIQVMLLSSTMLRIKKTEVPHTVTIPLIEKNMIQPKQFVIFQSWVLF